MHLFYLCLLHDNNCRVWWLSKVMAKVTKDWASLPSLYSREWELRNEGCGIWRGWEGSESSVGRCNSVTKWTCNTYGILKESRMGCSHTCHLDLKTNKQTKKHPKDDQVPFWQVICSRLAYSPDISCGVAFKY